MVFDMNEELNGFYKNNVVISSEERSKLGRYRDACLDRLKEGFEILGRRRRTRYRPFIRAVPQGSYPMYTLNQHRKNEYDIDVALIFRSDDLPATALQARRRVADALLATEGNFRRQPEARTNAVTVWYADGPHVDLAIYREVEGWFSNTIEHAGPQWAKRDPEAVTKWFHSKVESRSPSGDCDVDDKQLRKVVRLVKAFARSRVKWELPGGMILTALTVEQYQPDRRRDDLALLGTLERIHDRLKSNLDVSNPVNGESLTAKPKIKSQMKS